MNNEKILNLNKSFILWTWQKKHESNKVIHKKSDKGNDQI